MFLIQNPLKDDTADDLDSSDKLKVTHFTYCKQFVCI